MGEPLTPRDVQRLLDVHGLAPRKAAGQNFVVDPNTVRRIVREARIDPDDTVLEVGPGLGSLTVVLAGAARRVVAVEIDAGMIRALAETVGSLPNVEVVHADALATPLETLVEDRPVKLVANLPYNVATPLVVHALDAGVFDDIYVMVQREVGERWSASVGDPLYAGISVKLTLLAEVAVELTIPRTVFHPVPNVDSVMVRLTPRPLDADQRARVEAIRSVVDAAFAHRRKTIRNTLRPLAPEGSDIGGLLEAAGVAPGARAEELGPDAFARVAAVLDARAR